MFQTYFSRSRTVFSVLFSSCAVSTAGPALMFPSRAVRVANDLSDCRLVLSLQKGLSGDLDWFSPSIRLSWSPDQSALSYDLSVRRFGSFLLQQMYYDAILTRQIWLQGLVPLFVFHSLSASQRHSLEYRKSSIKPPSLLSPSSLYEKDNRGKCDDLGTANGYSP